MDRHTDHRGGISGTITDESAELIDDRVLRPAGPRLAAAGDGPLRNRPVRETVSLVIPTKNEARNVAWVLRLLPHWIDEVVLVDRSTDGTVDGRPRRAPRHRRRRTRRAPARAPRSGTASRVAQRRLHVMIDADGSMDPAEIRPLHGAPGRGYDLVKGSRFAATAAARRTSATSARPATAPSCAGERPLRARASATSATGDGRSAPALLDDIALRSDGFEIETEMVVRPCAPACASPRSRASSSRAATASRTCAPARRVPRPEDAARRARRAAPAQAAARGARPGRAGRGRARRRRGRDRGGHRFDVLTSCPDAMGRRAARWQDPAAGPPDRPARATPLPMAQTITTPHAAPAPVQTGAVTPRTSPSSCAPTPSALARPPGRRRLGARADRGPRRDHRRHRPRRRAARPR